MPALAALILGYFAGREHIKYQMRSAMSDVAEAFSKGLGATNTESLGETQDAVAEPPTQLLIGKTHSLDDFSIRLTSAKIATSSVKDMIGQSRTGENPDLALTFTVANKHSRKILRFRKANQFLAGHFRLRDDVDNAIRGVNYGAGSKVVGALSGSEDILPGKTASHIELFSVPPPKTKFLILTVNLACFGGKNDIEYKIPAASIER